MALTLIGFVGPILGQPDLFGVEEKDREMAGFIHMWRVLGYLHGIEDEVSTYNCSLKIVHNLHTISLKVLEFS